MVKRYKIWLALLLSLAMGCGSVQNADGEKQTENLTQTETQKQGESVTQAPKRSEITIQNSSTGQKPTPTPNPEDELNELVLVYDGLEYENVKDITIGEDGTLYALCITESIQSYEENRTVNIKKQEQWIYAFDKNGKIMWRAETFFPAIPLVKKVQVDSVVKHIEMGRVLLQAGGDGCLYMVVPGLAGIPVLYQLNLETWEWQELYRFARFSEINNLVFMGDRMYVHGLLANPSEKELVQNPEYVEQYQHRYEGQTIGYMDMENLDAGVTLLPIDVPGDMIKLDEDTLGIYQTGDEAWRFWKYTPAQELWEKTDIGVSYYRSMPEESEEKSPWCEYFSGYGAGCIYRKNIFHICYETEDGTEQILFTSADSPQYLQSDGTFLYYYTEGNIHKIQRMEISKLLEYYNE